MRILFATMAPIEQGPSGPTSVIASARYRVLIPAQQLLRMGHAVQIALLQPGDVPVPDSLLKTECDVLVLSKSYFNSHLALVSAMQSRGVRVQVDYCDDHFDHPEIGPHFRKLAELADGLVASTEAMADAIRKHTGREAAVVTDPVEAPRGEPRFSPRLPALSLAWFGHGLNLAALAARADELRSLAAHMPVKLAIVTAPSAEANQVAAELTAASPGRVTAVVVPWSREATWKAVQESDAVWIPVAQGAGAAVKSPNRLVESLWLGRLAIADAVPSYQPFADLVPVGTGLEKGVMDALADPAAVERRLGEAQRRIAARHSGYACARQWAAALGDTEARPLKLNLGCGDKILPGYVNVDVVEARAGFRPDVVCDLHALAPFEDASADEILSVHVVEHFWRWEVRDILREWVRVLKPGGRMVIECPNLESACRTFLEDPDVRSREDQEGQRTMWVFYGDPKWKDPLMIHRWGYTPKSLLALLAEAGLAEVRQEPAQFKLREPRDMRITGVKP